ncbi:MAG TPA: hypothetical protein VFG08_10920, partial [Candidatus Polarisedimenticolia bacterium]|nr:hypothetical protein [Candidatus Polarisedimenticolia bacterium]
MARSISRRDMLRFIGGATVGIPLTPLLWKSTDDLSIWTQNWERIPRLPRGPETVRFTHCTLCPAGCPVRARCIAGRPVSLTGVPATSPPYGALCPFAYASHQMPFDPRRVTTPLLRAGRGDAAPLGPAALEATVALVAGAMIGAAAAGERVAIIDSRPHSTLSQLYARFLASVPGGVRLSTASPDDDPLATLASMLDGPCGPLGFDLQNSRMILSFGAPLLEGWGTPVQGAELRFRQASGRSRPRIVQVETRPSHTARLADRWLPIRPGTETAVALGLAHVIVGRRLHDVDAVRRGALDFERDDRRDFLRLVERFSPERVAALTGLSRESLIATAIEFATRKPAVALWGGDPGSGPLPREAAIAIAALNLIVG